MENTPNIRFKGFVNDWEERKLDDISDVRDGTHDTPKYLLQGHPFITSKNVGGGYINYDNVQYISDSDFEEINKRSKVDKNDILMGMIGTIGNIALIRETPDFAIKNVALIKDVKKVNYLYLYHYLQSSNVLKQLSNGMDGGTQKFIALNKIRNLDILLPNEDEQQSVGEYLERLDNLITLHQRKCDETKELKKYMLQKMFPKNGEKIPEIRFEGFTDDWEQRKLGNLVDKYEDPVETPDDGYERLGIRSHAKGTFHGYVEPGKELDTAKMHRVAANKLILNITFAWEHAVAITDENDAGKLVSHRFPQFSFTCKLKPKFFKYVMLDRKFREHLELSSPGGAGRNRVLKLNEMLDYVVKFPSVEEQKKISDYFDTLDNLITLHQCKCDELKEVKKYMLQNMFPQKG